ncbi:MULTISPECIES: CoA ester lyase [Microbacterium]|uniref:HpcH/HpaI aldolase/citrate lyase family protein n=1 Tax=Microbacterium TaxID=33882 RepID=UPI00146A531D|nr:MULTISPECIES: CoA ester lyase [Microbacterium]
MTIPLTALYVPGDREDRVAKALASQADIVIVDLEDAVAPRRKDDARSVLAVLSRPRSQRVQVRVNVEGSPWHAADVAAVAGLEHEVGIRLPKVESAATVAAVAERAPDREVHALIESALGVEHAFAIAAAGAATLALGEADLRSQLGLPSGEAGEPGLLWSRSRLVTAAAAAGLPAPMMSVYADVSDLEGLAASCARGRALGFVGRTAIHPRQLPVIERAFIPSTDEVARAQEIVSRVGSALEDDNGTVVLEDGTFLDVAMVQAARRTLQLAERAS